MVAGPTALIYILTKKKPSIQPEAKKELTAAEKAQQKYNADQWVDRNLASTQRAKLQKGTQKTYKAPPTQKAKSSGVAGVRQSSRPSQQTTSSPSAANDDVVGISLDSLNLGGTRDYSSDTVIVSGGGGDFGGGGASGSWSSDPSTVSLAVSND